MVPDRACADPAAVGIVGSVGGARGSRVHSRGMLVPVVITANRLTDGIVVFLDAGFGWVTSLQDAAVLDAGDAALARAKQDEARQIIVEPYAIEVSGARPAIAPKALREAIRAHGPTIRRDLAKPNS